MSEQKNPAHMKTHELVLEYAELSGVDPPEELSHTDLQSAVARLRKAVDHEKRKGDPVIPPDPNVRRVLREVAESFDGDQQEVINGLFAALVLDERPRGPRIVAKRLKDVLNRTGLGKRKYPL